MKNKVLIPPPRSSSSSFTLVELIIVIIIVGILAAVGITQYSLMVEKGRVAEAKVRIGTMRQLAYQYYLENGSVSGITDASVGVDSSCTTAGGFYKYYTNSWGGVLVRLFASRCGNYGRIPNSSRPYTIVLEYYPATDHGDWSCTYTGDGSSCLNLL